LCKCRCILLSAMLCSTHPTEIARGALVDARGKKRLVGVVTEAHSPSPLTPSRIGLP